MLTAKGTCATCKTSVPGIDFCKGITESATKNMKAWQDKPLQKGWYFRRTKAIGNPKGHAMAWRFGVQHASGKDDSGKIVDLFLCSTWASVCSVLDETYSKNKADWGYAQQCATAQLVVGCWDAASGWKPANSKGCSQKSMVARMLGNFA